MSVADRGEQEIVRAEFRWGVIVFACVSAIMLAVIAAGVVMHINPPSNVERINPQDLHLSAEFTEANLGTKVETNGQITSRIVATQFQFVPRCVVLPADTPVTIRLSSPDVIHGILVTGTNVNTMVVPGYVSQVHTVFRRTGDLLMPCHEYCGLGHSEMFATVRVVPKGDFHPGPDGRVGCAPQ
jgi:cytochrome c oxidase subunit 2